MLDAMMSFYWRPLIEGKERETYTIFLKGTAEFVGEICLYNNENSQPEMGISILKEYRGQGIGRAIIKEWSAWVADYIGMEGGRYYRLAIPVL